MPGFLCKSTKTCRLTMSVFGTSSDTNQRASIQCLGFSRAKIHARSTLCSRSPNDSASRTRFAAIQSVSGEHLGHTNRNVSVSRESQCEIALVNKLSRPIPDYQQGELEKKGPLFRKVWAFWRFAGRSPRTIRICI